MKFSTLKKALLTCITILSCLSMLLALPSCGGSASPYLNMTKDELSALNDEDLTVAVLDRIDAIMKEKGMEGLNPEQKHFYLVNEYSTQMSGGIAQYFSKTVNASSLSSSLNVIGALEHKDLYDAFVEDNKIDFSDLSAFDAKTALELENLQKKYPMEKFKADFEALPQLSNDLVHYVRTHLVAF